jgi:hypothetical protein
MLSTIVPSDIQFKSINMLNEQLTKLPQPQRDRLTYVELRLRFMGKLGGRT